MLLGSGEEEGETKLLKVDYEWSSPPTDPSRPPDDPTRRNKRWATSGARLHAKSASCAVEGLRVVPSGCVGARWLSLCRWLCACTWRVPGSCRVAVQLRV